MGSAQHADALDGASNVSSPAPSSNDLGSPFSMVSDPDTSGLSDEFNLTGNYHDSDHDEDEEESASSLPAVTPEGPNTAASDQPDVGETADSATKGPRSAEIIDSATWKLLLVKQLYKELRSNVPHLIQRLRVERICDKLAIEYMLDKEAPEEGLENQILPPTRTLSPQIHRCKFFLRTDYTALSANMNVPEVYEESGPNAVAAPPDIIEPPKQIRSLIKLYVFNVVRYCDPRWDGCLQDDIGNGPNPKFQFLRPLNPYHAYYQWYKSRWPKRYDGGTEGDDPEPLHTSNEIVNEFMRADTYESPSNKWCDFAILLGRIPITVSQGRENKDELAEQDELKAKLCQHQLSEARTALETSKKRILELEKLVEVCSPKNSNTRSEVEFKKRLEATERVYGDRIQQLSMQLSEKSQKLEKTDINLQKTIRMHCRDRDMIIMMTKANKMQEMKLNELREHYDFIITGLGEGLNRMNDDLRITEWYHECVSKELAQSQIANKAMSEQLESKHGYNDTIMASLKTDFAMMRAARDNYRASLFALQGKTTESLNKSNIEFIENVRSNMGPVDRESMKDLRHIHAPVSTPVREFQNNLGEHIVKDSLHRKPSDASTIAKNPKFVGKEPNSRDAEVRIGQNLIMPVRHFPENPSKARAIVDDTEILKGRQQPFSLRPHVEFHHPLAPARIPNLRRCLDTPSYPKFTKKEPEPLDSEVKTEPSVIMPTRHVPFSSSFASTSVTGTKAAQVVRESDDARNARIEEHVKRRETRFPPHASLEQSRLMATFELQRKWPEMENGDNWSQDAQCSDKSDSPEYVRNTVPFTADARRAPEWHPQQIPSRHYTQSTMGPGSLNTMATTTLPDGNHHHHHHHQRRFVDSPTVCNDNFSNAPFTQRPLARGYEE